MTPHTDPPGAVRDQRAAGLAEHLRRAQAGERDALDAIVRELNPVLWHVARAQGLDAEHAADVVQTTWLELVRRLASIHTPQALTGWLVTAARREAWRVRRRERGGESPDSEAVEAAVSTAADLADLVADDERRRVLWRAVRALSQRCQDLLRVVAMVDRPDYDEVARALAMPRGSIGPTRGRCLAKLRELLLADPVWSRP